jgi:undecaprenyl diphosphate synthase
MAETGPLDPRELLGLEPEQLPRHIAIIMDGNGRWAQKMGLPRINGHAAGAESVREIVTTCARIGVGNLTLFSFSMENWKRPPDEIKALMQLYAQYLVEERETIVGNGIRFRQLGRREGLPDGVLHEMDITEELSSANRGMNLMLALNYGSRLEIVDAVKKISGRVKDGELAIEDINDQLISDSLYTAGTADPDLLVRTSGERRISNFLLWQISYAELHVTDVHWPEFRTEHLFAAIHDYASRERRFGGLKTSDVT